MLVPVGSHGLNGRVVAVIQYASCTIDNLYASVKLGRENPVLSIKSDIGCQAHATPAQWCDGQGEAWHPSPPPPLRLNSPILILRDFLLQAGVPPQQIILGHFALRLLPCFLSLELGSLFGIHMVQSLNGNVATLMIVELTSKGFECSGADGIVEFAFNVFGTNTEHLPPVVNCLLPGLG